MSQMKSKKVTLTNPLDTEIVITIRDIAKALDGIAIPQKILLDYTAETKKTYLSKDKAMEGSHWLRSVYHDLAKLLPKEIQQELFGKDGADSLYPYCLYKQMK